MHFCKEHVFALVCTFRPFCWSNFTSRIILGFSCVYSNWYCSLKKSVCKLSNVKLKLQLNLCILVKNIYALWRVVKTCLIAYVLCPYNHYCNLSLHLWRSMCVYACITSDPRACLVHTASIWVPKWHSEWCSEPLYIILGIYYITFLYQGSSSLSYVTSLDLS